VVRRYAPRIIRTMRAQRSPRFPGMARDVLAHLQIIFSVDLPCSSNTAISSFLSSAVFLCGASPSFRSLRETPDW
jgi:hypothetical protein